MTVVPATHAHPITKRSTLEVAGSATAIGIVCALVLVAAALGASASTGDETLAALLRATMVAAPLAAALYAWDVDPFQRFARLLLVVALVSFASTFAESGDATLYSFGRAAGWTLELLLVVLVLAFPDGPLSDRADRRLAAAMGAVVAIFYLPTLLLVERPQVPSPYTSCTHDCPSSVFFALEHQPSFAKPLLLGTGSVLVFIIMLLVLLRLRGRARHASLVQRQALVPVLAIAATREALVGGAIVLRQAGAADDVVLTAAQLIAWATPAIALAFLVGLVRMRLASERALRTLALSVQGTPTLPALQRDVGDALDDPSLRLTLPGPGAPDQWYDVHGDAVAEPAPSSGRCVRTVRDGHRRIIGSLDSDAALADRPELLDAAGGLIAVALENRRLESEAHAAAVEVRESRARIAASADEERRRIERDLHDGAQQRLVALRIELGIVEDMLQDDPAGAAAHIRELEASAEEALEELRALAHGVRPPLLNDRGMAEALRSAVARSGMPITLTDDGIGRYPPEIESAIYFCVLEALQNVAKHARGARRVRVRINGETHGELWFDVRDDGEGAESDAAIEAGAGVTNMRDRMAAVDGMLRVVSQRGVGTVVFGRVPVPVHPPRRVQRPG